MPKTPYRADSRGGPQPPFPAHDGGDGDDVIRIGGMPHAQEESQECKSEWRGVVGKHRVHAQSALLL
jgi:hypothetical protein